MTFFDLVTCKRILKLLRETAGILWGTKVLGGGNSRCEVPGAGTGLVFREQLGGGTAGVG